MTTDFITDLITIIEDSLRTRIEQVHLQVSRNQHAFPGYASYNGQFHEVHDQFVAAHPDLIKLVDEIISLDGLRQDEISKEIYWQGVRDCLTMMKHLKSEKPHSPRPQKCCTPYKFSTSDPALKQFFHEQGVEFADQHEVNGKMRWTYPWSLQIVRLLDEYTALMHSGEYKTDIGSSE